MIVWNQSTRRRNHREGSCFGETVTRVRGGTPTCHGHCVAFSIFELPSSCYKILMQFSIICCFSAALLAVYVAVDAPPPISQEPPLVYRFEPDAPNAITDGPMEGYILLSGRPELP